MEGRQSKMLAVMSGALALLVAAIYLLEPPAEDDGSGLADRQEIPPTQATRVHLVTAEGGLTAERAEEGWWIVEPFDARADDRAVEDLIGAFDRLRTSEPFEDGAPESYGLDTPAARLTVAMEDGTEHTLVVGAASPVGLQTYVQVDGEAIRVAQGRAADHIALPFDALRDARVLRFAASAVKGVAWEAAGEGWAVERREDGWWLSDGRRADDAAVEGHLAALGALEFTAFLSPEDARERGLESSDAALVLTTTDGELRVVAGREDADGLAARAPGGAAGLLVAAEALRPYLSDLLETRLLPVDLTAVSELRVALPEASLTLTRSPGAPLAGGTPWMLGERALSDAEVAGLNPLFAAPVDRAAAPERGPAEGSVTAFAGDRTVRVELGPRVEGGRVGWEEAGPPFLVPDETLALLEGLGALSP